MPKVDCERSREILDPVGTLRVLGLGAASAAEAARRVIEAEGAQVVSLSADDNGVYVTPPNHPFSRELAKRHSDRIVGTYDQMATADEICEGLLAQWAADRAA